MIASATGTVTVYRDLGIDDYADVDDDNTTPHLTGVLISILEQGRAARDPVDTIPRTVRYITGRVTHGTDIRKGDRLVDDGGVTYTVASTHQPYSPFGANDLVMELEHVDNA